MSDTFGDTKPSSGGYRSFRTKLCTGRFNCGFRRCRYDIQLHTGLTHGYFSALSWYQLKPKTGDITLHSCFLVHLLTLCHTTEGCQNSKVDCLLRTLTSPSGHLWWLPIFRKNATCHLPVPLWYLHLQVLDRVEDPQPPAIRVAITSNLFVQSPSQHHSIANFNLGSFSMEITALPPFPTTATSSSWNSADVARPRQHGFVFVPSFCHRCTWSTGKGDLVANFCTSQGILAK